MAPTTYVALEGVTKNHGVRTLLDDVSIGVVGGARIGVVGRNGGGKTTLVEVLCGVQEPDTGRVTRRGGLSIELLTQKDYFPDGATLRSLVVGELPEHEWAGDARIRDVMDGLLGGVDASGYRDGLNTRADTMSGGEGRRASLAHVLLTDPDLLVLDEPTNHLDVEAVDWLAGHLAARRGALLVVTHDRWFLDAVSTQTWEVTDGAVLAYEGGYAAYVLARAERDRQSTATEDRRQNLLRKELAWLRRGPPARTSKPKFRIDAANALIADEPAARDRLALQKFATARLGKQVYDLEDVSLAPAASAPEVLHRQTWRLGPGDRIGLLGPNGAGKTTLLRLLAAGSAGELDIHLAPDIRHGTVRVGKTVAVAHLSQTLLDMPGDDRVLESLQRLRQHIDVGRGRSLSAQQLLEGFGFTGERLVTRVGDLSGGERRRLQLLRLLVDGPNVLLLDEPTNDLDVETLTVLEDLLDSWPGTLVVVSHDRYFLERTTDTMYGLLGNGSLRYLTGGVEEYLRLRRSPSAAAPAPPVPPASPVDPEPVAAAAMSGGETRAVRKELAVLERRTENLRTQETKLHDSLAAAATDHEKVRELTEQLRAVEQERAAAEEQWLERAAALE
ncbi:MAG TPA: ABC-F family ATP-binding cassette domain-containing protein [Candidatus Nanopelagicales bacterium]|jgi:ATP-binding cassette subfamily F protein uup